MEKYILLVCILAFMVSDCVADGVPSAVVSVGDYYADVGEEFTVVVNATSLEDALAYSFRVVYNSSILEVTGVSKGDYLNGCSTLFENPIQTEGIIGFEGVCLGQTVDSGSTLALIDFKAVSPGKTGLELNNTHIIVYNAATDVNVSTVDGSATVNEPIPAPEYPSELAPFFIVFGVVSVLGLYMRG